MYAAWLFFGDHFKDVYFPDTDNWTSHIVISQEESGWSSDEIFLVRALEGSVFLTPPSDFFWSTDRSSLEHAIRLEEHNIFRSAFGDLTIILKRLGREQLVFRKYVLETNTLTIGRGQRNNVFDSDQRLSTSHGYLSIRDRKSAVYTDQSANGTYLNGRRIINSTVLIQYGDVLTLPSGLKLIFLSDLLAVNAIETLQHIQMRRAVQQEIPPMGDLPENLPSLYSQYHRAPRILQQPQNEPVEIEPPIAKQQSNALPTWLQLGPSMTMVLPMLMGTMFGGLGGSGRVPAGLIMVGTSSVLAVIWGLINRRYRGRFEQETEGQRVGMYQKYIGEMEQQLRSLNTQEFDRLTSTFPNVGECAALPSDGSYRLWSRMPSHPDFLHVRVGLGKVPLPSEIITQKQKLSIIDDPLRDEADRLKAMYSSVDDAPVIAALRREAVVGILGGEEAILFAQGLLMQIAALHSYHDVRIAVFSDEAEASRWSWARWLPHVFASEDRQMRMVASTPSAIHEVMNHIGDLINMRRSDEDETAGSAPAEEEINEKALPLPHHILFCTNPNLLENEPVMRTLLTNHLGITLVMVAPSMEFLPKECHIIFNAASKRGYLHTSDGSTTQVDFEYPNRNLLQTFALQLAPLRVKDAAENAAIPTMVSFLDIYGVRKTSELDVWRMWSENHTYDGLRSVIGFSAGSQPFVLDISEKYHGPHGLIAGTTGSGKSVMLQTYILSLAMNYSPRQVQFILIDYKGGGMADAFRTLPHTAGIIDNLQGDRIISRALASLNGEIHRRETLFQEVGVKDITEYTKQFGENDSEAPVPHLIIITDEFAELKSDQPEFMKELVSASRVGRSLGIHLILATQKPSASVSDEIWANSRFHLCLRVQTVADSRDMLKRPDAAYIKGTGRCFIQIGNDESFDQVQTSYAGMPYNPNEPRSEELPQLLSDLGQTVSVPRRRKKQTEEKKQPTQLEAVLDRIIEVADAHGIPQQRQMWLPEMPEHIYFEQLAAFNAGRMEVGQYPNPADGVQFLLGLGDDTAKQRYIPYMFNLTEARNMLLVGLSGSGKTTLVQSIVYSLANRYDPSCLNMYILSLTSQTLGTLRAFPHVGDVVFEEETMEVRRLINMLSRESQRRSDLFAKASTDSFIEYNRSQKLNGQPIVPAIVVFVDRFEQLRAIAESNESVNQSVSSLVREGSSRGIHFIATALSKTEVPYKLHPFFEGVALQQNDRSDYSDVLSKRVPLEMPPIARNAGRGLAAIGGELYEFQVGLAGTPNGDGKEYGMPGTFVIENAIAEAEPLPDSERAKQVTEFAEKQRALWKGPLPAGIPRIPPEPVWESFIQESAYPRLLGTPFTAPLGYDLVSGELSELDLEENFSLFVTGPKRSGKTNALKYLALVMKDRGAEVHVIGDSEWTGFARENGIPLHSSRDDILAYVHHFQETILRDDRSPKKRVAKEQGKAALRKLAMELTPYTIIVDNAQRFNTDFNNLENGAELKFLKDVFSQLCVLADHYNLQLFLSAPFSAQMYFSQEPLKSLISMGRGISMGGKVSDCNPLGIGNLIPSALSRAQLPIGQGLTIFDGKVNRIVLPLIKSADD